MLLCCMPVRSALHRFVVSVMSRDTVFLKMHSCGNTWRWNKRIFDIRLLAKRILAWGV